MHDALIGIGSNIGDREKNCDEAMKLISEREMDIISRSSKHETEPWGVKDQPFFINMAVRIRTGLTPSGLLERLKAIEKEMGRGTKERWGPRIIDLDILFYDDLIINGPDLTIPHPHLTRRDFVLKPLLEIAPDTIHPVLKKSIREIYEGL